MSQTTANSNTAVGYDAMRDSTTGTANTAMGKGALNELTTGTYNIALGENAGGKISTGTQNVFVGYDTGAFGTNTVTGAQNIIVGNYSHTSATDSTYQTVLGYNIVGSADSSFTFGQQSTDTACVYGATTLTAPSDVRLKEDVQDAEAGLDFINALRPVTYRWKKEKDIPEELRAFKADSEERTMNDKINHGFIAQEVKEAIDSHSEIKDGFEMWSEDDVDGRQRIGEGALVTILTKAVQELSTQVDTLTAELSALKGE
jgi:hypothetical protein